MATGRFIMIRFTAGLLAAVSATACTSRDERAAIAAAAATDALQGGNLPVARAQVARALAARDDVSDYWLLSAHIALAEGNAQTAFGAYESALTLDRGNAEALTRLCQIAVSANQPERAEGYAGQLIALRPGDKAATDVQAAIALERGDKATATRLLDTVLTTDPHDAAALLIKSRLLVANEDYPAAARAAEASLAAPGDPVGRLVVLEDIYRKDADAAGWRRTIARLARAQPASVPAQLDYARSLYDIGDAAAGIAVTRRVLALHPGDVAVAGRILHLWLAQTWAGGTAMPVGEIVAGAAGGPPETRAAFAAYANALSRPDLALRALGDASDANTDVAIARGQALALLGRLDAAGAAIGAVLAVDGDQPRALAVRASLRTRAGDRPGAVEDLRHALSGDPDDAQARLALAELQLAGGDGDLAAATLHDGLGSGSGASDTDPRLAGRLAALLRERGRAADAAAFLTDYARANPFARHPG